MRKLNDRQELFCHEYLRDFNARQAAIRSGYSERSAAVSGSRNLRHPAVVAKLRQLMDDRQMRIDLSADYVLQRFLEIDKLDVANILDAQGNVLPVEQWPSDWRRSVAAMDIQEVKSEKATVKKIRLPDKLKNLELIGKHIDVSAFRDRLDLATDDGRELVIYVSSPKAKDGLLHLQRSLAEEQEE